MSRINLDEQLLLADAVAEFERVKILDNAWTQLLEGLDNGSLSQSRIAEVEQLVARLDQSVETCATHAAQLQELFATRSEQVEQALSLMMHDCRLDSTTKKYWMESAERAGGFAPLAVNVMRHLVESTPAARTELAEKLQQIKRGEYAAGDLPPAWGCAVGIGLTIGLGVAATVATGGLSGVFWVYAAGAAIGSGAYCGKHRIFWEART
jgi:hypothetical protein